MYPDAQLLAEGRIERFEERLVEIRHRLALVEPREELGPVHAVECRRGPVQHLDQAEWFQTARVGQLLEQGPQHGRPQMPDRLAPPEPPRSVSALEQRTVGLLLLARPQHPCGEDAVEQRLDQGRAEEPFPAFALEPDPERFLQCRADGHQRRRVARRLDTGQAVACVGSQQPRQVLRLGQGGPVRERPGEILAETRADLAGKRARRLHLAPEVVRILGQAEGFELGRASRVVHAHQNEVP